MRRILILLLVASCSLVFQHHQRELADRPCASTAALFIADFAVTAAGLAVSGYAIVKNVHGSDAGAVTAGSIGGVGAVLFSASAGNGVRWWRECRRS